MTMPKDHIRQQKKEDGFYDGRFVPRKEKKPETYLDEEEHIEQHLSSEEDEKDPEFEIEKSEHRL